MLRGGTTPAGQASAASHTGALSGEGESWRGWARQSGVLLVTTLKEFVQTLRLAELSAARGMSQISDHVLLVGNGGGCSVLAADSVSRAGLTLHGWSSEARDRLDALPIPPGMSVENPVDVPATALVQEDGVVRDVFDILGAEAARPWVIAHLNLPVVRDNMLDPDGRVVAFAQKVVGLLDGSRHEGRIVLVLRGDGSADCARLDRLAREAVGDRGLPVFTEIDDAVVAIRNVAEVERLLRAV
jgi:acyl-CoA synthetase (NDP forming)